MPHWINRSCLPHWTLSVILTRSCTLSVASDMGSNHPVHAQLIRASQVLSIPPSKEMLQLLGNSTQADVALWRRESTLWSGDHRIGPAMKSQYQDDQAGASICRHDIQLVA